MKSLHISFCPKCGGQKFKTFDELTDDEKFVLERFSVKAKDGGPGNAKSKFCVRCWFEVKEGEIEA